MAANGTQQQQQQRGKESRNHREVFLGDLERRRPTKRQTTVRSFNVVRNWAKQNVVRDKFNPSEAKPSSQETSVSQQVLLPAKFNASKPLHKPLSVHNVSLVFEDYEGSPLKSPVIEEVDLHSSLPGRVVATPVKASGKGTTKSSKTASRIKDDDDDDDDDNDGDGDDIAADANNDMIAVQETTPEQTVTMPQVGLQSGPEPPQSPLKKTKSLKRKASAFEINSLKKGRSNNNVNDEEYEAQNFVRLFNADRGRKQSSTDITDLDIILTNIEEIALEIKNKEDLPLCKKVVREAFIQLRQIFSDSIDVYKEKKYLQSATTKTNSRIKKMKQELIKVQAERKRTQCKLEELKAEYEELEKQKRQTEEAYSFLTEFESLQERLKNSKIGHNLKESVDNDDLTYLLTEASGYLSTERQLRNINDKLERWVDKNKT